MAGRRSRARPRGRASWRRCGRRLWAPRDCCRQPGRTGQPRPQVSPDGQLCQPILDGDQPRDIRPDRFAQLAGGSKDALVALHAPGLEHRGQVAVERPLAEGKLDHAADPGRVQRHLLLPRVRAFQGCRRVNVLVPEPAQAKELLGGSCHTAAFSWAITASATWIVPTAVGSSRFSLRSYVTFLPRAMTSAIAVSIRSAAACSSRWRSISTPDSITAIGLTLFWPAYLGALPWVASKTAPLLPMLAPGARPRPPIMPAPRSEMMSPYRFGQHRMSYSLGRSTSCIHMLSTIRSSNSMSLLRSATWRAIDRNRPSVCFMMFALCTAVTFRRLLRRAESKAN